MFQKNSRYNKTILVSNYCSLQGIFIGVTASQLAGVQLNQITLVSCKMEIQDMYHFRERYQCKLVVLVDLLDDKLQFNTTKMTERLR